MYDGMQACGNIPVAMGMLVFLFFFCMCLHTPCQHILADAHKALRACCRPRQACCSQHLHTDPASRSPADYGFVALQNVITASTTVPMFAQCHQAYCQMPLNSGTPHAIVQHHFSGPITQRLGHAERLRTNVCRKRKQPICQGLQTRPLKESNVDIHSPYQLQEEQIKCYRESGFVRLQNVFDNATLAHYTPTVSLEVAHADKTPLEEDSDYQKAFTQVLLFCPCECCQYLK